VSATKRARSEGLVGTTEFGGVTTWGRPSPLDVVLTHRSDAKPTRRPSVRRPSESWAGGLGDPIGRPTGAVATPGTATERIFTLSPRGREPRCMATYLPEHLTALRWPSRTKESGPTPLADTKVCTAGRFPEACTRVAFCPLRTTFLRQGRGFPIDPSPKP
jgi:hypothetical protein